MLLNQPMNATWRIPAAATFACLLPGGVLDPGHVTIVGGGGNDIVWFGSGVIHAMEFWQDTTASLTVEIYDLIDANAKTLALTATPFRKYALRGPNAVAEKSGNGRGGTYPAGTAFMDVRIPAAPANPAINANGRKWRSIVPSLAATAVPNVWAWTDLDITCLNGMAIVVTPAAGLGALSDVNITYTPHKLGAQRMKNALVFSHAPLA